MTPPIGYGLPGWAVLVLGVALTGVVLFMATRLDPERGALTISVLVVLGFLAALTWAMRFQIPQDPDTAALVGGLVSTFGAVVAYWIGGGGNRRG